MRSQQGFAITAAMAVLGIIGGILGWTGGYIKDKEASKVKVEVQTQQDFVNAQKQIHDDLAKECFDKDGNPRSPELCKPLNDYDFLQGQKK